MENPNDWFRTYVRAAFLLVALGGVSLSHAASAAAQGAFDDFMYRVTGAGKQTVGYGKDGTPTSARGVPAIEPDGGTMPKSTSTGQITNSSGNKVGVTATGRIPGAQISKALGRAFAKALPGVSTAIAIKELADELGYELDNNPDGSVTVAKDAPFTCTAAPCYEYRWTAGSGTTTSAYYYVPQSACTHAVGQTFGFKVIASATAAKYPSNAQDYRCNITYADNTTTVVPLTPTSTTTLYDPPPVPATQQEFLDAVAAKSGWPSTSAVGRALADPSTHGAEKLQPEGLTVTGPATSPGKVTQTTNTTNNTTTTATTTHHHTYAGDTVTTTSVTITNTVNNTTGDTIESTTTTETPDKEDEKCKDGDTTLGCAESDTPELETPKETKTVTYSEENVFGSGSCPADVMATINTLGQTVKVWDWQKTCNLALPLRALVLALAGFAAILIVMPGSRTV